MVVEKNTHTGASITFPPQKHTPDERLFPKDQFDFAEVQVQLFSHYVHGLLTESGLELYKNYQKQNDE